MFVASKEDAWRRLSAEIGAEYIEGGFFKTSKVSLNYKQWKITLDTYTVSTGKSSVTYTRITAPFNNKTKLHFRIYRKGLFSDIGKFLGMQDIKIGDAAFDEAFIIQGNNEKIIKDILMNEDINYLFKRQKRVDIAIHKDRGLFSEKTPEGYDEIYFRVPGVIKDLQALKELFILFTKLLDIIANMNEDEQVVNFTYETLQSEFNEQIYDKELKDSNKVTNDNGVSYRENGISYKENYYREHK